jgi:hypothetical protein
MGAGMGFLTPEDQGLSYGGVGTLPGNAIDARRCPLRTCLPAIAGWVLSNRSKLGLRGSNLAQGDTKKPGFRWSLGRFLRVPRRVFEGFWVTQKRPKQGKRRQKAEKVAFWEVPQNIEV